VGAMRIAALAALLTSVSAVMAVPASAEPLSGTYAVTGNGLQPDITWVFTPCGPDCLTKEGGSTTQLHRQGTMWTGYDGISCKTTIDESSLTGTLECGLVHPIPVTLTKVG
jgi:hypothetical protein